MHKAEVEVRQLLAGYRRRGSKTHRSQMVDLAVKAVLDMIAHSPAQSVHQLGNDHVRHYWKALRTSGLAYKTQMTHFYALARLWSAIGRTEPPRPWMPPVPAPPDLQLTPHLR